MGSKFNGFTLNEMPEELIEAMSISIRAKQMGVGEASMTRYYEIVLKNKDIYPGWFSDEDVLAANRYLNINK